MEKNFKQNDYLDTLRVLNSGNINQSIEFKNYFFDSLISNEEFLPEHVKELSISWKDAMKKQSNGEFKNYILNNIYVFQIARQLTDMMIEDKIDSLYLNSKNAHHILTYLGSIQGEKELVEIHPQGFDVFKQYFLLGLITRYSSYVVRTGEYESRFYKLVNIYIEQQLVKRFGIEQQEELNSYVDEKFINDVKKANEEFIDINKIDSILMNLLKRKSSVYRKKSLDELIEECKQKLFNANTKEEKDNFLNRLKELYSFRSVSYYSDVECGYELKK